jgi:hypothetical protein
MTTRPRAAASSADQYETEQAKEWGKYTARVAIDFYGTRAYNVGDPVPASAVDGDSAWIPSEYVATKTTAFEGSATVPPPEPPTIDPTADAAPPAATPDAAPPAATPDATPES